MPDQGLNKQRSLAEAIRSAVPTNMRVFAGTMFGDTSPITEQNFSSEELQSMRANILRKQAKNKELENMYRSGGTEVFNMDLGEWVLEDNSEELASFENTRNKTAISYDDYASDSIGGLEENSLLSSFTDPDYNVATTLGQYVAHKDKNGKTVIRDVYDWNKVDSSKLSSKELISAITAADNLRKMGNAVVRLFKPNVRREVVVDLGILEED